jgi:peptide/nickel transport system permease protein
MDSQPTSPATAAADLPSAPQPHERPILLAWLRQILSNRKALVGVIILLVFVLIAVFARLIAPGDPLTADYTSGPPLSGTSAGHIFGTDQESRDIFRQMVDGTEPVLFIGFSVAIVGTLLSFVGVVGGYAGGWIDEAVSLVTNVFLVIPSFPLVVVLSAWVQVQNDYPMILVISLTSWAFGARVLRSQALSIRQRDFVMAAIVSGESHWRIVLREILPNMISLVVSGFIGLVVTAMGSAAGLFFLGLGNISGEANWFTILYWAQNAQALERGAWWAFAIPGVAIALVVVACSLINYGIDEISNPRLARTRDLARRRRVRPARSAA